jgi:hypothetical protein
MEFKCSICDYTSDRKNHVIRHISNKTSCGEGVRELVEVPINTECEFCFKTFASRIYLNRHLLICKEKDREEITDKTRIPLRDKDGNIVDYAIIDEEVFDNLNKTKWCITSGYANSGKGLMHRLILKAEKGQIIDHINHNKLDNRKENLRFVSHSQNAQNMKKKENATSKYRGVCRLRNIWACQIRHDNQQESFSFKKEEHAAYWYDQLVIKHYGEGAKINKIDRPDDFVEPIKNPNRAIKKKKEVQIVETIEVNDEGIPVIYTSNGDEILVDEDRYRDLIKYSWCVDKVTGYALARSGNDIVKMHIYLTNPPDGKIVDHINNNKLDNRLCNLRICDKSLNAHNRTKKEGTLTDYIGVRITGNKYYAQIQKDKKQYYLGTFKTQKEAALAYNKKALELYGETANLNVLEN